MKKTYSAPQLHTIELRNEGVICASLDIDKDGNKYPGIEFQSVDRNGWDSSNWAPADNATDANTEAK